MANRQKNRLGIILFLLPVSVLYIAFFIYPIIFTFFLSVMEWNGIQPMVFVGMDNFTTLFGTRAFRTAIRNNVIWALAAAFIQIPFAMLIALILARQPKGWKLFRTLYFLPNVISGVALAMMWTALYNAEFGLVNYLLELMGMEHMTRNWLGEINTALPAVIISKQIYVGYFMVIILAGTMAIPKEFYEAAEIDGASIVQQEFFITIPVFRGIMVTAGTLAVAFALRQFEETFLMTAGGPANSSTVMGLIMYRRMSAMRYGEAAATGVLLIVLGVLVIFGLQKLFGKSDAVAESQQ